MKRVLLYRFDRPPLESLVQPAGYIQDGQVQLMTTSGSLQSVPLEDVKALCFASEPGRPDLFTANMSFERRPKQAGLWVRFEFRDHDRLEGILEHNLLNWPPGGFLLTPPNANSTRQRIYVPRSALAGTEILGTIGKAASKTPSVRSHARVGPGQMGMFD